MGRHHLHRGIRGDRGSLLRVRHGDAKADNDCADSNGYSRIDIEIKVSGLRFAARLETQRAPKTCERFKSLLPLTSQLIQARWSGESAWIPLGELELGLGYENHTSHPAPGELLLYPGGISETEILFPYGATLFASKMGQLAGNHFATITEGHERLKELGDLVLWKGAQEITITALP